MPNNMKKIISIFSLLTFFISVIFIFTICIPHSSNSSNSTNALDKNKTGYSSSGDKDKENLTIQAPHTFKHTGLLNSIDELKLIKSKISKGEEPWKSAFQKMQASNYAKVNYTPTPYEVVFSDINGSNDHGANAETNDAIAAYTEALMWIFTGDERYAETSSKILDAWSSKLKSHQGQNWYLQAAWAGSVFPLSAELLRATYPKWTNAEISQFSTMLNTAFLPILNNRLAYGNRELSVCNALVAIGVFNNDRAAFYQGINHWISYVPCYFYISDDGLHPTKAEYCINEPSKEQYYEMDAGLFSDKASSWIFKDNNPNNLKDDTAMLTKEDISKNWYSPRQYANGMCGETGRDLNHSEMAFASAINTAEIAWHQGIDLYTLDSKRLTAFMETTASLRLGITSKISGLYSSKLTPGGLIPTYEIAYNHYHNRKKILLPTTNKLITAAIRKMQNHITPAQNNIFASKLWSQTNLNIDWETLTHAELN